MRTLKYAILGLLNQKKMTGYDLMKQFESALCEFWSAKHSQIYPELKKLTEEGCVAYSGRKPPTMAWRKSCTILPKRDGQISCPGSPQKRRPSPPLRTSPG